MRSSEIRDSGAASSCLARTEFDRDPDRFRQQRIDAIIAAARPYLRGADWGRREHEWMGPRPMTPDGLPLIGRLPGHPRVLLATGHNMLGLMLAPATARLVTGLLVGGTSSGPAAAFDPARDARLHRTGRLHRKGRSLSPPVIYPEPLKSAGVR